MGNVIINNIVRNPGAPTQQYRIEMRKQGDLTWTIFYTISYDQAQLSPLGILPLAINIPDDWVSETVEVQIISICDQTEIASATKTVVTTPTECP